MEDAFGGLPDLGEGAARQAQCERAVQRRIGNLRAALGAAGYTEFEISRAMLHAAIGAMQTLTGDADVVDDCIAEARHLAEQVVSASEEAAG